MNSKSHEWYSANQRYLGAALLVVRQSMKLKAAREKNDEGATLLYLKQLEDARRAMDLAARALPSPSSLDILCSSFGLSHFERDLVLLCTDVEMDACFLARSSDLGEIKNIQDKDRCHPTFGQALEALPGSHWSAISPGSPIRRWRLIKVATGKTLTSSHLSIDERVLHFLAGIPHLDERLEGIIRPVISREALLPSQIDLAERISRLWSRKEKAPDYPLIQICGQDHSAKLSIAAWACDALGVQLHVLDCNDIPEEPEEREELACIWEREFLLEGFPLLVDSDDREIGPSVLSFLERLQSRIMVTCNEPLPIRGRRAFRVDLGKPTPEEQIVLWRRYLGDVARELDGKLNVLVNSFNLDRTDIEAASQEVIAKSFQGQEDTFTLLWNTCRSLNRPLLDGLAQQIEPVATWDDLVLPEEQVNILKELAAQVRQRSKVYDSWGFASKGSRGLGISALFSGSSGTGKTMAAEVLANELGLDLYRIDLSQVVNKYIGETEKNLKKVFDAAENSGAILLFDEADALFGKRSEVRDSHDRFANIEVSYLLQRMEAYQGLAILTTNMKKALDEAFLRRIRFIVQFPFPDTELRSRIWRRIFPDATPRSELDYRVLGKLNVAGGNIRNIALYAAFLAAEEGVPVGPKHLRRAALVEFSKLERPLPKREIEGLM